MGKASLIPRRFRVGQIVQTKGGVKAKVIGSAIYGTYQGKATPYSHVEYRLKSRGSTRTFYRKESQLQPAGRKK